MKPKHWYIAEKVIALLVLLFSVSAFYKLYHQAVHPWAEARKAGDHSTSIFELVYDYNELIFFCFYPLFTALFIFSGRRFGWALGTSFMIVITLKAIHYFIPYLPNLEHDLNVKPALALLTLPFFFVLASKPIINKYHITRRDKWVSAGIVMKFFVATFVVNGGFFT